MSRRDPVFGPGLGESQRAILEGLRRHGQATLSDLEDRLDLATETLRDHLKALSAKGLVERAGVRRQGPGRPRVEYRLSATGEDLFPRREGELLRELAGFLVEAGHSALLEEFFTARAERKRAALRERVAGLAGMDRLQEVAAILSDEGFMAEIDSTADEPRIRLCHCPLREVVAISKLPCRAEMALVRELVGASLHRLSFMPDGDHTCTYSIGESGSTSCESSPPDPTN